MSETKCKSVSQLFTLTWSWNALVPQSQFFLCSTWASTRTTSDSITDEFLCVIGLLQGFCITNEFLSVSGHWQGFRQLPSFPSLLHFALAAAAAATSTISNYTNPLSDIINNFPKKLINSNCKKRKEGKKSYRQRPHFEFWHWNSVWHLVEHLEGRLLHQ